MKPSVAKILFWKEFSSYFKTPLGYVFLVIFLFGLGHLTFEPGRGSFFYMREASLHSMFRFIPWLFIFLIPAVSMRLWAEERKSGSIELLFTMPITISSAVVAKFLASLTFIALGLACTFPMIITVAYLGSPDWGVIFFGYLSSLMVAAALLAVGSFFSALTKNQVVSFILSVVVSTFLLMAGSPPVLDLLSSFSPKYVVDLFESLSVLNHFENIEKGVLTLGNLWFFGIMTAFWLGGNILLLKENRAN